MGSILYKGIRWSDDGSHVVYDLKRTFNGGGKSVYTGNSGKRTPGGPKVVGWWDFDNSPDISAGVGRSLLANGANLTGSGLTLGDGETPSTVISSGSTVFSSGDSLSMSVTATQFSFKGKSWSVSAWVRLDQITEDYAVLFMRDTGSIHTSWWLAVEDDGVGDGVPRRWYVNMNGGSAANQYQKGFTRTKSESGGSIPDWIPMRDGVTISLDTWCHVVLTYEAGIRPEASTQTNQLNNGLHLYIDGVEAKLDMSSFTQASRGQFALQELPATWYIGSTTDSGAMADMTWTGDIADFAVWSGALDEESVRGLFYAKDNVYYQIRNFANKGSTTTLVGQDEGLELEDFLQGQTIKSFETLYKSTMPKIHANSDPLRVLNGKIQDQRWFDDDRSPSNFGYNEVTTPDPINHPNVQIKVPVMSRVMLDTSKGKEKVVPNHRIENRDLGMTSLGNDNRPFQDMDRYNPVVVIGTDPWDLQLPDELLGASFSVYDRDPVVTLDASGDPMVSFPGDSHYNLVHMGIDSYSGISLMDGVLEPFPIRKIVDLSSIDIPFQTSGIRADGGMGHDTFRRSFFVEDQYMIGAPSAAPWLDSIEFFGSDVAQSSGSFTQMGLVMDEVTLIRPFNDTTDLHIMHSAIGDSEIYAALTYLPHLSGSLSLHYGINGADDGINDMGCRHSDLKRDHVYAAHGFDYIESPTRADSLMYGGLKR
jgi:hypothetical protein